MLLVARLTACSILTPCHSLVVFCCSRRRDGSDPSDEDELYIADLHGTTQNVAEDRGSKSQPTEYAPFSRGSHYSGKNGESIAEAHAELDGALVSTGYYPTATIMCSPAMRFDACRFRSAQAHGIPAP